MKFFLIVSSLWISLGSFTSSPKRTHPEQIYRLVDRDLSCDSGSKIIGFEGYSVSTCASACKGVFNCGMFAVYQPLKPAENNSSGEVSFIRANVRQQCELCQSTNVSSAKTRQGWSLYMKWMKDFRFVILDTDNRSAESDLAADDLWNIDCNRPEYTSYRNGAIVGIWDDKDNFRDLDKVKCMNWGRINLISEKSARILHIHLEDYRRCPKDYILTAITASNAAFRNVDKGKCSLLSPEYVIDYEHCVTVNSEAQDGGSTDKWRPWRVQCPTWGPHVAVSLNRRRRIHTGLQCCTLRGIAD